MTRPAGVTARGLPYPGSTGIHANTPGALQALAEAISGQLTAIGGAGEVTDMYVGAVAVSANKIDMSARFPKLASVTGMVANIGAAPALWFVSGMGANTRLVPLRNREPAFTGNVTIVAIAWGPPL